MTEPTPTHRGRTAFDGFAEKVSDVVSGAPFFAVSVILVVLWMPTVAVFASFDTWQLVINTVASVMAFLLIALLQNSERRSDHAAGAKLDVLAAAVADVLALQIDTADRQAVARRIEELRGAIRLEEEM